MKQRPILFSTPMVQAIRKGTKKQTRRIVNPQPTKGLHTFISPSTVLDGSDRTTWIYSDKESSNCIEVKCPYGQPGDVLWVRETWFSTRFDCNELLDCGITSHIRFKADNNYDPKKDCIGRSWKPSIHMPKSAARIWLKITNVRLEQLQDISRDDARAEGIERDPVSKTRYKNYVDGTTTYNERTSFYSLWESINGEESLLSNPFVWVIEFEEIEKPD